MDESYNPRGLAGHVARLTFAALHDRLCRPRARSTREVPYGLEALTVEWLTDALCTHSNGARVLSFKQSGHSEGTSVRARLELQFSGDSGGADLPASVFAKTSPGLRNRIALATTATIRSEALFYREIRPQLTIEAPRGYFCAYDLRSGRSIHIMEDLTATKQATFCTPTTHINRPQAELMVTLLADLHARFYAQPDLISSHPWIMPYRQWFASGFERFGLKRYHDRALREISDVLPPDLRARADEIWSAKLATIADHDRLPTTILHGDVHLGNWYLTGAGDVGLCDWQCPVIGTYAQDLAYAVTTALRVEDRRAWERDLIGVYVDRFNRSAAVPITFEEAWQLYRRHALAGMMMWTPTLVHHPLMPDMQPRATSLEILRRCAVAMSDLATLDAI